MKNSNKILFLMILIVIISSVFIIALPFMKIRIEGKAPSLTYGIKQVQLITVKKDLGDFNSLRISGISNVTIEQSNKNEMIISASENLTDCVEHRMFGNELNLKIDAAKRFFNRGEISVTIKAKDLNYITTDELCRLEVNNLKKLKDLRTEDISYIKLNNVCGLENFRNDSLCYLKAKNIRADKLYVRIDGLTIMDMNGYVKNIDIRGDGLGRIYAAGLLADYAEVRLDGFVYVYMSILKKLKIDFMDGLTKFTYYGSPEIDKRHIDGMGKIEQGNISAKVKPLTDFDEINDIFQIQH